MATKTKPVVAEPTGQVGHVALPKPPKVGHNPSNMQNELLITQYDNNHDEINQQAIAVHGRLRLDNKQTIP